MVYHPQHPQYRSKKTFTPENETLTAHKNGWYLDVARRERSHSAHAAIALYRLPPRPEAVLNAAEEQPNTKLYRVIL